MNNNKRNLQVLIVLMFLIVIGYLLKKTTNIETQEKNEEIKFAPSLKEGKKDFVEYLDSTTLIYSNFKYNIAIDFPDHWSIDKGVSEHTIIRGSYADSGLSLAINVIELEGFEMDDKTIWDLYDQNEQIWENEKQKLLQEATNEELYSFNSRKVHLSNVEAIEYRFSRIFRQVDLEFEMQHVVYEFFYHNCTYSVGLQVPWFLFNENPQRYNSLFYGVSLLKRSTSIEPH